MEVRGYKVFRNDWTCSPSGNTKQYACPGDFTEDLVPVRCGQGMHFCRRAIDCFNYYSFDPDNKVAEVVAYGEIVEESDKCCTNKLKIVREISWQELLGLVNTGKECTGKGNTGDRNTGNYNTGDWNTCDFSNGCFNTVEPKIYLFNKPSKWSYRDWLDSDARYLLNQIPTDSLCWTWFEDMTEEEKNANPTSETTGGYLKKVSASNRTDWWRELFDSEKATIKAIPNFDKEIFKEITGIDVEE